MPPENRFHLPSWVLTMLAVLFLSLWGSAWVTALTFRGCTDRPLTDPKKSAYCNISIVAGAFFDLFPVERAKRSPLFLDRGMLRATLGNLDAAKRDFRRALLDAADAQQNGRITIPRDLELHFVALLFAAMQREAADDIATITWFEVVRELSCGSPDTIAPDLCSVP